MTAGVLVEADKHRPRIVDYSPHVRRHDGYRSAPPRSASPYTASTGAESVGELLQVLDVSVEQSSKRLIAEFDSKFA